MGIALTDVLLFGKAQLADVDKATLVIYRRNILRWSALGGYLDIIVKGVSPLSLPDAIANSLSYVKAFGGTEQRNLPDNYLQRQFIYMMDGSYLAIANQSITSDYKIEFDFATTNISTGLRNYFGARASGVSAGGGFRLSKLANQGVAMYGFDTTDAYESGSNVLTDNTRYKYVYENGTCTLSSGGTDILTHTYTVNDTSTITAFGINAYTSNGTTYATSGVGIYCYGLKIWNGQGELVMNLVPAVQRGTVPVVGFYDTVSGTFKTATAGTFAAGGEAVPTPDAPIDIICNNGVLKARHQSGLPLGYTLLDYIESDGTQYIDTGIIAKSSIKTEFMVDRPTPPANGAPSWQPLSSKNDSTNGQFTIFESTNSSGYGYVALTYGKVATSEVIIASWVNSAFNKSKFILDGGVLSVDNYSHIITSPQAGQTFNSGNNLRLFMREGVSSSASCTMYYMKLWDGNTLVRNMIPAKNASNVVGMYDLVSGQFFTNQGTGDFTAGSAVSDPIEIYTDGLQETIAIKDDQSATIGTATAEMLLKVGDYTDEQEVIAGNVTRKVGVKVLDGTENWILSGGVGVWANFQSITGVAFNTTSAVCSHSAYAGADVSVANMNQNEFSLFANGNIAFKNANTTSTSDWTTFLANQYAAGTPVIVVYPLATPTTESVAGQPMSTAQGDNTAEITQASLTGLELEAKYQAAVSLTIQEVQDANLDPNVQVTIN